jgi:replicative DNA helicase
MPDAFYSERHRLIFSAMLELAEKHIPIDLLSLANRLTEKGIIEEVGGRTFLTELVGNVPSAANIEYYANIVASKYLLRRLIEASERVSSLGYNEERDVDELLDEAQQTIYNVSNSQRSQKYIELRLALGEAWNRLDALHKNKGELRGVPTGFRRLDNLLAGFQKSDLVILAARPSVGKTAFALDIARKTAVTNKTPVAMFSLEMSNQQLVDRMLAAESQVNAWKLRTGGLTAEEEFGRIRDALDSLSKAPIFINDEPGISAMKMRSVARRLKAEKGLGLIVVDYLQLMMPTQTRSSDSLVQQVTEISRSLKHLARELDVPVLALSQLSRDVEKRGGKPRLSDLRDSGSIEQDADVVMFIHRPDRFTEGSDRANIAEIHVEKHRNGPTGMVELYFDDKRATFVDLEKDDFGALGQPSGNSGPNDIAGF